MRVLSVPSLPHRGNIISIVSDFGANKKKLPPGFHAVLAIKVNKIAGVIEILRG